MFFKRIELNGFKSFADPTTIEFTDGITCIVGPNGSGKSNLSDAVRWVLGEQSPKNLRGGKMEEVIFAGTQTRRPKGMAEVTLVIDNSERTLPIDFAEVGITRRMYRSGESEYRINRSPCRLRDIRELIMDTGIGVEGYSIIGQGKIADIVSDKMESRREIFEEAAGIVKYRSRKTEAERKLASAQSNLARIGDIIGEIEARIGGLEEDSRKAQEYLDLKDRYTRVEINITLRSIEAAEEKRASARDEEDQLQGELAAREKEREEKEQALRTLREQQQRAEARALALQSALLKKTEEIHEIRSREALNEERRASLEKEKRRLSEELKEAEEKRDKERSALSELEASRRALEIEQQQAAEESRALRARSEEASASLTEADDQAGECRERIFALAGQASEARAESRSVRSLSASLQRRLTSLQSGGEEALQESELSRAEEEAARSVGQLEREIAGLSEAVEALRGRLSEAEDQNRKAGERAEEARVRESRMAARLRALEELEAAKEGFASGVKTLLDASLPGIRGVLGDLIRVPEGWETAIESVLGGQLNDIVCEDEAVAKRAIQILKEKRAGRLTFLPIQTLRAQKRASVSSLAGEAGFLGLASEKVSCAGEQKIADYLLGRVVVCDTLDHALALSKKNNGSLRFVTLEGEVIHAAGAITGGVYKHSAGGVLSRRAEQEKLARELGLIHETQQALRGERERLQELFEDLRAERAQKEQQLQSKELARVAAEKDLVGIRQQIAEHAAAGDKRAAEIASLQGEIRSSAASAEELEKQAASLEEERKQAEKRAEELERRCEALRLETDRAIEAENQARMRESNLAVQLKSAKEMEERVSSSLRDLEKAAKQRCAALEKAARQLDQIGSFSGGASDALREKEGEKKAIEEEAEAISAQRAKLQEEESALERARGELEKQTVELQLKKQDALARLARFEAQSESLKEKLWTDFEVSYAQAKEQAEPDFVLSRALRSSREYRERLRALGDVHIGAIEEYRKVKERYDFLTAQRSDIEKAMEELRSLIRDMDRTIKRSFKESFDQIAGNFDITFRELFQGGHATLSLAEPDDPLGSAIEIEAQPPGKKLQNINLLSGGEKTMTAIALMFAVLKSKPTPFCILDEVEAALDDANIEAFARSLRRFEQTQFALITHQKATMEYADVLYGVTMPEQGVTQVLSLKLGDEFEI